MRIFVLIDTSVLVTEFSKMSSSLSTLSRLSKKKLLYMVLPDLVNREFLSRSRLEATDKIIKIQSESDSMARKFGGRQWQEIHITLKQSIDTVQDKLEEIADYKFNAWKLENRVRVLSANLETFNAAFFNYFKGHAPFNEPKIRKDIPDAIIFQEIISFHRNKNETDTVLVACGDVNLNEHIKRANLKHTHIFSDLASLVDSSYIKSLIDQEVRGEREVKNINLIISNISMNFSLIEQYIFSILEEKYLNEIDFEFDEYKTIININFKTLETKPNRESRFINYLGKGLFSMQISGSVNFSLLTRKSENLGYEFEISNSLFAREGIHPIDEDIIGYIYDKQEVEFEFESRIMLNTGDQLYQKDLAQDEIAQTIIRSDIDLYNLKTIESYGALF